MRQLGGSVGIATAATVLDHWGQQARAPMVEAINPLNPAWAIRLDTMSRYFQSSGLDAVTAQNRAYALMERIVQAQSATIADPDTFVPEHAGLV